MKITKLDRRRAIWRFPEFQKDYERYKKLKSPSKRIQFTIECTVKWKDEFDAIARAEEQAGLWSYTRKARNRPSKTKRKEAKEKNLFTRFKERGNVESVITITDTPCVLFHKADCYENGKKVESTTLSGDCLYLKIRLKGKRLDDLMEECREVVQPYHAVANPPGERERKTDIPGKDIWAVYDLYEKTGENMTEASRQLFGLKGQYGYDWDEKYFKQTKKAVDNAIAIIEIVRKELSLNTLFPNF